MHVRMSPVAVGFTQPLKGPQKEDSGPPSDRRQKQLEALIQRATYEFRRGEHERARMLGKYLRDVESSPEGTRIYALCAHQLGDEDGAWANYPAALEAFPRDLNLIVGYAELCINRIELEKAHGLLTTALELDPEARHPAGAKARILILKAEKGPA
jgi:Tfp pilus assembly protein PilF